MAENEVVRTIRVRGVPEGLENLTSQLQRAEQAYSGVGAAASSAGTATQTGASKLNTTERAYRSLTERLDSTARVYRQLQTDTRTLSGAFDAGFMGKGAEAASRFNSELLRVRQNLQDVGGRMATGNVGLDKSFGIGASPSKSARESADVWEEQGRSLQKLRQQYDPLGVAQDRYASAIDETNKLLQAGQISETQHLTITTNARKVLEDTTKAYNGAFVAQGKYASGAGLARHELINLSRQVQDVGVSLASGQSPLTVLIQQGTQIADVFASSRSTMASFFAQAARGVAGFALSGAGLLTGSALAGGAAIAAGVQYASGQREIERAMAGVGRQSGVTVSQINRLSEAYADAAKVSTATAREMLAAFASTGRIDAGFLSGTAGLSKNFAAQMGISASEAAKTLAGAFVDPAKGAQDLNKELGFLDARTLEYIRTAQAQGRIGEAQKALADSLGQSVQGAADRTNGLARAWNSVWNAASRAWDALGKATGGQDTLEDRLARLIEARRQAENRRSRFGLSSALSEYDTGISDIQEQIRRQQQQRDRDTRSAREKSASTGALSVIDELNPFGAELRRLETMAFALKKGLDEAGSALNPDQARQVAEAYERIQKAIQLALPPAERQKQLNDITVQSISARTLAERTSAEVARIQIDSAFKLKDTEEQRLIILGKINEMQAQANREARDALRTAKDQAEVAGLRPYQRRLREIDFRERDNRERFGGTAAAGGAATASALPASTAAVNGLDNAFAATLKKMVAEVPGLSITSGFRTYEQQAKLYAEKPGWAARPGTSNHEFGVAADIAYKGSGQIPSWLRDKLAAEYGVSFPLANRARNPEPWHVEPNGGRGGAGVPANGGASAGAIAGLERSTAATEAYNSIIRSANDNLAAQKAQLQATRDTLFMSTEEVVKAQKAQELYNQAVQEGGVGLANALLPEIQKTAAGYGALAAQQEQLQRMQDSLKTVGDLGRSVISGMVSDLRNGASGADMFRNALDKIASKLLDMALNDLFGKAFGNNAMGLFGNGGGGGFFGGVFNFFSKGSGGLGLTPGAGGLYASGGYTGAGGKYDAAGIVHRGEYVFSAASVNRIGLGNLDSMHRSSLPGYAGGGYVSPTPYSHAPANQNAPGIKVDIHNTMGGQANVSTERRPDGSLKVVIEAIKGDIADGIVRRQGPISSAMTATASNRQLRG